MQTKASLWQIFSVFAGIGTFTIGGGYAMIPLIEAAMRKRGWISEEELPDIVVLAQSAPGLLAVNMAIYAIYISSKLGNDNWSFTFLYFQLS